MNKHRIFAGLIGFALATAALDSTWSEDINDDERKAVERACLDYVEGIYELKPEWIKRSVHPDLKKYGFWHDKEQGRYRGSAMTFEQLHKLAGEWNKDGKAGKDAPKKVEVFDVLDKTAAAKLTAYWGTDYFHLVKEDGRWMIYQVLWQSPQPTTDE